MKVCPQCQIQFNDNATFCGQDGSRLNSLSKSNTSSADSLIGTWLDAKFKILSKLGQGGMGAVYKAEHVRMGRLCAIKVVPPDLSQSAEVLDRFEYEAKLSGLLKDPHAIGVYDFGKTTDGMFYLVMEFVDGETISSILRRNGQMPLSRVIEICKQAGAALADAHSQKIIHRDLKPDNIMISNRNGQDWVEVLDFGIAKFFNEEQDLTKAGLVMGTPAYMSPEQVSGDKLDVRSDVYSFALIVYQMLVGALPFPVESSRTTMISRLMHNPQPPSLVNPSVVLPKDVETAIMSALARNREERTPTIEKFIESLESGANLVVSTAPTQAIKAVQTTKFSEENLIPEYARYNSTYGLININIRQAMVGRAEILLLKKEACWYNLVFSKDNRLFRLFAHENNATDFFIREIITVSHISKEKPSSFSDSYQTNNLLAFYIFLNTDLNCEYEDSITSTDYTNESFCFFDITIRRLLTGRAKIILLRKESVWYNIVYSRNATNFKIFINQNNPTDFCVREIESPYDMQSEKSSIFNQDYKANKLESFIASLLVTL
ncbi:MAG: serine/threonine protein kinase bacterial [bacterium]|nr:MAG: serine/threonine protein kinase bacterial [bacterium]